MLDVDGETLRTVLLQTQFGHIWPLRAGCCLILAILLLIGYQESLIAVFAFAMLASLVMIGFGAWNLLVLKPRLFRAVAEDNRPEASVAKPIRSLVRSVACEILLAGAVILVIGFLGVTSPPPH
jgi:putative copper export protein